MKISADYRMLALDALRGKWKTAVLTGIAASALGATIVSSSNSVVSNSNQAKDIHFNLFAQPNGGRLLAVLLVGIGLWAILQLIVGGAVQLGYAHFRITIANRIGFYFFMLTHSLLQETNYYTRTLIDALKSSASYCYYTYLNKKQGGSFDDL